MKKLVSFVLLLSIILSAMTGLPAVKADAATKLSAPSITKASSTKNSVSLTWTAVKGADAYNVYVCAPGTTTYKLKKRVTGTSAKLTGLFAGCIYKFKIAAVKKTSGKYVAQTKSKTKSISTKKLAAPVINSRSAYSTTASFSWDKVSGADKYFIYKMNGDKEEYLASVSGDTLKYNAVNYSYYFTASYKVAAVITVNGVDKVQKLSEAINFANGKAVKAYSEAIYDCVITDADGNDMTLESCFGKPLVINIWATWCGPCTRELPAYDKVYKKYSSKVNFIIANCEDYYSDREYVKTFIKNNGYSFPVYFDRYDNISIKYGNGYIPQTIIFNSKGELIYNQSGGLTESKLTELVEEALK